MKRLLFVILCFALLTGCATTNMLRPAQPPALTANQDSSLLVILRDGWLGSAIVFCNYLDGKFIGETTGSTYFVTQVPPGEHYVVGTTENTAVAYLNFEAGKRYFLRQGVTMGIWRARTSGFFPVAAGEAQEIVQKLTYLELDTTKTFPDMEPKPYQDAIDEYKADVEQNPDSYKEMLEYKGE